ncbi:peptidase domain-containing ABC transporter [Aestuariivirga sp.]|uniref:peptidase domain-containing ABC transporter n=1 Tax=Aestuariivirga sp. TaxID=2650926 RepID=UPI0039E46E3D
MFDREEEHPIRAAHRRIADAFARVVPPAGGRKDTGLLTCLLPIAESIGWQGTARQIAEAMPHDTPVNDVESLRMVLQRIGIETEKTPIPAKRMRNEYCPCLAITSDRDLVLVNAIQTNTAQIFDPKVGDWRLVKRSQLSGDIYTVRLLDLFAQQEELLRDGFVWPFLRKSYTQLKLVFWQSFVINVLGLASSLYVMYVYDKAIGTKSVDTLAMLFMGGLAAVFLEMRLRGRRGANIARLGARFDALAVTGAYQAVLELPLFMSEGAPLNAQLTRFKQFQVGREIFGGSLATSLIDLPFTFIFFAMMFIFGGYLGFIPVGFAVILALIGIGTSSILTKQMRDMGDWKSKSDSILLEICSRLHLVRADNAEDVWLTRAIDSYRKYLTSKFASQQFSNTLQVIAQAGVSISGSLVLGLGAVEVMSGQLSLGALVALMAVLWRVLSPIQIVFLSAHRLKQTVSTVRQIDKLIQMKREREAGRMRGAGSGFVGRLSLTGVCFRYQNRTELSIKNVSLDIAPGEIIALVGPSGAGKSTLLKLMLGIYQPQSGSVRLDDFDLRQIDTTEVRQSLGYLGQDPSMFYGTVAQNLRLVAPDASDDELVYALGAVGISVDDPALPEGLETRLNSSARRSMTMPFIQRLALAQVFLRKSPVLFLDEPANHLDRDGDQALMNIIAGLRGKSTVIMTTARPSHMKMADKIVVLNDGAMVAKGRPEEILPVLLAQQSRMAG